MQSLKNLVFHRRDPLPRISIIGLYDSGKTTILYKLASSEVKITVPTIALNIEQADITIKAPTTDGKELDFTTWVTDLGGASKLHPIIQMCMVGRPGTVPWVSGIVWVIDATDQVRFPESHEELRKLLPKLGENQEIAPSVPVLILLNKSDLPEKLDLDVIRPEFDNLLAGRPYAYFETCSTAPLASSGLAEAFAWLGDAIASPAAGISNRSTPALSEAQKSVDVQLADMRSPLALSAELENWLGRAEKDSTAEDLLQQFYAFDLPNWDHYTRIRLIYILLSKYGRRQGKDKIFGGFEQYIENNAKTEVEPFHMAMTYFWIQMVHLGIACTGVDVESHTLKSEYCSPRLDDFAGFLTINQYLVDEHLWADYYSEEVLMSPEAKEGIVFPDIKGLPDLVASAPANPRRMMMGSHGAAIRSRETRS